MATDLSTHINFHGRTRKAVEFYRSVFGGELSVEPYGDYGISESPEDADRIVWGVLHGPEGFVLRGTDDPRSSGIPKSREGWALCLNVENGERLTRYWSALSDAATVIEAMATAPSGDSNGVLRDRFGITWPVNIGASKWSDSQVRHSRERRGRVRLQINPVSS